MTDLVIKNANILTLDENNFRAGSVAITEGYISGIWSDAEPPEAEIKQNIKTKIIDLNQKTLIPGFIDTHNHMFRYARFIQQVNCSSPPNENIEDLLEAIKTKEGDWIQGYGYDDTLLKENRHPTRKELDRVTPNHPVFIMHISGHIAVVNSEALRLANIYEDTSDIKGGHYGRDRDGFLNGVLYENPIMDLITAVIPKPTIEEMITQLSEGVQDYLAEGITTNTDAAIGLDFGEEELEVYFKAGARGINPIRTLLMIMHTLLQKNEKFEGYSPEQLEQEFKEKSNDMVHFDSVKMFQDGSIQGFTGALREPYYNKVDTIGELFHHQHEFNEEIYKLHKQGFRIAIHGNGDRAIESILDGYAYALNNAYRVNHRHRIEHAQTATTKDLDRMKHLGVASSFFINHVYYWGDRHQEIFLGPYRAKRINPLMDAVDRDLLFTLHSDCPITPISPLFSIWAAVNRITRNGNVLGPNQRIDVMTALKSMTIYGAKLIFKEDELGSIELGKKADFAILNNDLTKVDSNKIKDISILATIIDGKIVYEREKL